MKKLIFSLVLFVTCFASAGTAVFEEGGFLRASLNGAHDSQRLFESLMVRENLGKSGDSKNFRTKDGVVEIECYKSSIPFGIPFGCTLSLKVKGKSKKTPVYQEGHFFRASMNNAAESKALFESLDLEEVDGKSGQSKIYQTTDKKAEIYCIKSRIPDHLNYICTISISVK